jgi:hypothetical protein
VIGYYVHHVGRGHLQRACAIERQLRVAVTGFSSLARPAGWQGEWIRLPRDDGEPCREVTANDTLHWAPLAHDGLRDRMTQIANWIGRARPAAIVSDVSVEVALLARLIGVPTVVIALAGERRDPPHLLGYRLSSAIIAPWPERLAPAHWTRDWDEKTHYVGAFSSFDGRTMSPQARGVIAETDACDRTETGAAPRRVLVLFGRGGVEISIDELHSAARSSGRYQWELAGTGGRWLQDPWPELCRSDVVVTHAGNGCLAAVAAAGRPAVIVPQPRPFGEQIATATALHAAGIARVEWSWPRSGDWEGTLDAACELGGQRWDEWCPGDGAARAARAIEQVAAGAER